MWRELPSDTKWFEVELEEHDLPKVQVFPRAQWRKLSNGSFCITEIVKSVRNGGHKNAGNAVIAKIQQLTRRYAKRQLTWFQRQTNFAPLNLSAHCTSEAVELISQSASRVFARG